MATIIEILDEKIEHLSECAEKILKYGGKLMQCLEEMSSKYKYEERSSRKYDKYKDREKFSKKHYDEDDDEFIRYY